MARGGQDDTAMSKEGSTEVEKIVLDAAFTVDVQTVDLVKYRTSFVVYSSTDAKDIYISRHCVVFRGRPIARIGTCANCQLSAIITVHTSASDALCKVIRRV